MSAVNATTLGAETPKWTGAARRRGPRLGVGGWLALVWLVGLALAAAVVSWLPLPGPLETDFAHRRIAPGGEFWLGTDQLGRDDLSRVLFGARVSLALALAMTGATVDGLPVISTAVAKVWRSTSSEASKHARPLVMNASI